MWKEADCKIWPFSQFQERSLTKSMNQDDIRWFLRIHRWKTLTDREFQMGHLKFGKTAMTFSASAVKVSTLVDSIVDLLGSWKLLHKKNIYISKLKSRLRLINDLKILESIWLLRQIPWSSIWSKKSQSKVASIAAIAERKRMERASEGETVWVRTADVNSNKHLPWCVDTKRLKSFLQQNWLESVIQVAKSWKSSNLMNQIEEPLKTPTLPARFFLNGISTWVLLQQVQRIQNCCLLFNNFHTNGP